MGAAADPRAGDDADSTAHINQSGGDRNSP